MEKKKKESFAQWLEANTALSSYSRSDVQSRLRRVVSILPSADLEAVPLDELNLKLGRSPEFCKLSYSVKSQLRRSIKLYKQYLNGD